MALRTIPSQTHHSGHRPEPELPGGPHLVRQALLDAGLIAPTDTPAEAAAKIRVCAAILYDRAAEILRTRPLPADRIETFENGVDWAARELRYAAASLADAAGQPRPHTS